MQVQKPGVVAGFAVLRHRGLRSRVRMAAKVVFDQHSAEVKAPKETLEQTLARGAEVAEHIDQEFACRLRNSGGNEDDQWESEQDILEAERLPRHTEDGETEQASDGEAGVAAVAAEVDGEADEKAGEAEERIDGEVDWEVDGETGGKVVEGADEEVDMEAPTSKPGQEWEYWVD